MNKKLILTITIIPFLIFVPTVTVNATIPPYASGFKHGVNDTKTTYGLSNFMTEGGFGSHTERFNQGYIDGYCANSSPGSGSDADQGTFECSSDVTNITSNKSDPYAVGFLVGQNDSKTNAYDVTHGCNIDNYTTAQTYDCLNGYYDGNKPPYRLGYLEGIQGLQLNGTHTSEFVKGYLVGINGY